MHLHEKNTGGRKYYYLQHSYRKTGKDGKKSRVCTRSIYLGTAESLWEKFRAARKPVAVSCLEFGFVSAVVQVAHQIGLIESLQKHIPGERWGIPRWLYFLIAITNRLQHSTSKEKMGAWAEKTVLPLWFNFDPSILNSKSFWCVADDVLSEAELMAQRAENDTVSQDLFADVDDTVFQNICNDVFEKVRHRLDLSPSILLYDTTNFFTYIQEPSRSQLARKGHNKDYRNHLRQVGLALSVDRDWGIPFFYRLYRGNSHDSKTFGAMISDLIAQIKTAFSNVQELALVLDKGNNSKDNFKALKDKITWIGSLVPSQHKELLKRPITEYEGSDGNVSYFSVRKTVMETDCLVVTTYRPSLARKQKYTLVAGIEKLKDELLTKWKTYKTCPAELPAGIKTMVKKSRYGKYLNVSLTGEELTFTPKEKEIDQAKLGFGKNVLFTAHTEAKPEWVILNYHKKNKVEDSFQLLKDPELIRFRPIRHFTDTKICAFGFCCVMALIVIRVMHVLAKKQELTISPAMLKEELSAIKAVTMMYGPNDFDSEITSLSPTQQRLWNIFDLKPAADLIHYKVQT